MNENTASTSICTTTRTIPCLPFLPVKFVSEDVIVHNNDNYNSKNVSSNLDGKEAKEFYETVLSLPSKQKCNSASKIKKIKPSTTLKKNEHKQLPKSNVSKLWLYAQEGNVKELQTCLNSGIDVNTRDPFGWTALMCAVCADQLDMTEFLIRNGSDIAIRNSQGSTALDIAKQQKVSSNIVYLLNPSKETEKVSEDKQEKQTIAEQKKFCEFCRKEYTDSKLKHESSIAHLFSSGKKSNSATFYHIPESNRGFQIMVREGWDKSSGLGPSGEGQKFPVKTVLKNDRSCIGTKQTSKPKITHFGPHDTTSVKNRYKHDRPVLLREKTVKKREREKTERRNRHMEISFRRQFNMD